MARGRLVTAAMLCLAAGLGTTAATAAEPVAAVTCTNPATGGGSWQITIDYGKAMVDSYPARITVETISWFDPKDGGNYMLDRVTGALTGAVASSTGGYFRRGHCEPQPAR